MRRALKIAGITVGVIIAILLIIPLFVNVDKFRPEIETKVGQALNSKVVLGKLSLGLIPTLSIKSDQLTITPNDPFFPEPVVQSQQFKISIPLFSLLASPKATLKLQKPNIFVVERNGILNVQTMKAAATSDGTAPAPTPADASGSSSFLMRKIESARLTLDVTEAQVKYQTPAHNLGLVIDQMLLENLGLNAPVETKIASKIYYKGETSTLEGPFEFNGEIQTRKSGDTMGAAFDVVGDFSSMLIKHGATFQKAAETPLRFQMKGDFNKGAATDVKMESVLLELASFKISGKFDATGIGTPDAGVVNVDLKNDTSRLEDLSGLSPLLAAYKLKGAVGFYAKVNGPIKNPALDIEVKADGVKGHTPKLSLPIDNLKFRLKVDGTLEEPVVSIDPADVLIGKSDLQLRVKSIGRKTPNAQIAIQSKSLDLSLLSTGKESVATPSAKETAAAKGKPLDAALDEMADPLAKSLKNPMLDKAKIDFSLNMGEVKLTGTRLSNVQVKSSLANRVFKIANASLAGYGGAVRMSGSSRLIASAPTYDYALDLQNVDLNQLTGAHAPAWKGQITGTLKASAGVSGVGLKKAQTSQNLKGHLKGAILQGTTSLQLSKIVSGVMKQLPQKPNLQGNAASDQLKGKFRTLTMDSKIVGRKIAFNNLEVAFEPDEYRLGEMQFKANGSLNFDRKLDLTGNVFLSPDVVKWPEAVGKSGKIEIPVRLSGPMDSASPDIGYTVSKMGGRVLKKSVEKEVKKGLQKILEGQKPEDLLKGIFN